MAILSLVITLKIIPPQKKNKKNTVYWTEYSLPGKEKQTLIMSFGRNTYMWNKKEI